MPQTTESRRANAILGLLSQGQRGAAMLAYIGAMEQLAPLGVQGSAGDAILAAIARAVYEAPKHAPAETDD